MAGPEWLRLPVDKWPISEFERDNLITSESVKEMRVEDRKVVENSFLLTVGSTDHKESFIDISRFSSL